jgi:hypothetical protein
VKYWVGHEDEANNSITKLYTKFGRQDEWRLAEAERVGVGFDIPVYDTLTPRKAAETEVEKAA